MMPVTNWLLLALSASFVFAQDTAGALEAFRKGQYDEARRMLEKIVAASTDDTIARGFLALSRAASGSCEAAGDLRREFDTNPDASVRRLTGIALVQCDLSLDRVADAQSVLDKLQTDFPDDADVLYEIAKLHMKAWNDAILHMYQRTPASFRVNQLSGEIFEIQGRYAEAATEYSKAIEKSPTVIGLHFRLGRALLLESHDSANLRRAESEFEAELKLNPNDAVAEYEIGQIATAEQNPAAEARFEKAISLNPQFPEALIALAKIKSDAKKFSDAIPLLERAVRLRPSSESAHYALMLVYRNAGRLADSQREKAVLDKLTRPPEGEFTDFLKRLGEKAPAK